MSESAANDQVKQTFKMFDLNNDGKIDNSEWKVILPLFGEKSDLELETIDRKQFEQLLISSDGQQITADSLIFNNNDSELMDQTFQKLSMINKDEINGQLNAEGLHRIFHILGYSAVTQDDVAKAIKSMNNGLSDTLDSQSFRAFCAKDT